MTWLRIVFKKKEKIIKERNDLAAPQERDKTDVKRENSWVLLYWPVLNTMTTCWKTIWPVFIQVRIQGNMIVGFLAGRH